MRFTFEGRTADVARMTEVQRAEMVTEVYARLRARISERRWKKALGNVWRLICLWGTP